ncbi:hypothetical protein [Listeria booriae]|uniref:Uncharacterized protein n=1 Tax=Listeria booriae TaxID=1552123 RepID=A0A7X0XCZ4_9LIST|nr:hypothetical protein [Listeria booriae]MBC1491935.1 hypothetical protein [Listeria booriae]MBC2389060.1 hypothetical protein [Listeria booriae]
MNRAINTLIFCKDGKDMDTIYKKIMFELAKQRCIVLARQKPNRIRTAEHEYLFCRARERSLDGLSVDKVEYSDAFRMLATDKEREVARRHQAVWLAKSGEAMTDSKFKAGSIYSYPYGGIFQVVRFKRLGIEIIISESQFTDRERLVMAYGSPLYLLSEPANKEQRTEFHHSV